MVDRKVKTGETCHAYVFCLLVRGFLVWLRHDQSWPQNRPRNHHHGAGGHHCGRWSAGLHYDTGLYQPSAEGGGRARLHQWRASPPPPGLFRTMASEQPLSPGANLAGGAGLSGLLSPTGDEKSWLLRPAVPAPRWLSPPLTCCLDWQLKCPARLVRAGRFFLFC